jgi:hypothetical protein
MLHKALPSSVRFLPTRWSAIPAYLDCEFNGYKGDLISLALVIDDNNYFYEVLGCPNPVPWVAENLAYQVGWTTLVIKWESDERKGIPVKTPSDNFKWNQLGELYQWFTDTYAQLSLQELKDRLNENINSIYAMIDSLSEEELFKPHMRKWADEATKTAVWEVYKFIHVNTVAPFGTFRTKIRKWKKIAL